MKVAYAIDLHKVLTAPVILGLMLYYDTFTTASWTYLALHGSYGFMWRLKSVSFPDANFEKPTTLVTPVNIFFLLTVYWVAPWLLISSGKEAPGWVVSLSVTLCTFGFFFMFGADAQKFFQLKARPGLITDGFFARIRHPNYLGETLVYTGYATLSMHWAPFLINTVLFITVFVPMMRKKEMSMSRYPEWPAYVQRTGIFFPK